MSAPAHAHDHAGHSHGLVDASIKRSRDGVRAVALALLVLGVTAGAQAVVYALSGSVALLADLIHNAGDAATAIPLGIAFALRSARAERWAGLAVVLAILVSACVAAAEAGPRLIEPPDAEHRGALAAARAAPSRSTRPGSRSSPRRRASQLLGDRPMPGRAAAAWRPRPGPARAATRARARGRRRRCCRCPARRARWRSPWPARRRRRAR